MNGSLTRVCRLSGAALSIASSNLDTRREWKSSAKCLTFRPYVERATLSIAPLQIARGTQNKVLEAMAMRKAVVATPQALEGIDATDGEHVVQASSVTDWANAIIRVRNDATYREQLGTQARAFVEQHHNWSACLEPIGQFITSRSE